ncbi:AAA family ATPase [Microbacterium sp. RD1]|uniref:AAA family ATPase n=1 Tax=Microbacterium sp. RD1 TaxID=3457313 RepID=UPI003FA5E3E5
MTRVVVAVGGPRARALGVELIDEGVEVRSVLSPEELSSGPALADDIDVLILETGAGHPTARLVAECDARGIRIAPLCADEAGRRLAARYGLSTPLPLDVEGWVLAESLRAPAGRPAREHPAPAGRVVVVWGPHGAPGRSTLAIELAAELCRGGRRVALIDADAHAPSVALALGLADEGPGFAAACRQAELGGLDAAELERISVPLRTSGGTVEVLTGINRPGRWPELSDGRVAAVLEAARSWTGTTIVDVAASLERDEEIVSDLDGPRRNAATLAALRSADLVVAVCAADPVGVSRFVRAHAELRATVGTTPVVTVVNRLRAGTVGIDARGQVRRTLERFAEIEEAWFVPLDPRSADAALLAARPIGDLSPRSPLASAVRRVVGEAVEPAPPAASRERPRRRRALAVRVPRSA